MTKTEILAEQLQQMGATVHMPKDSRLPDMLVGFKRQTFMLNVESAQASQKKFLETWRGRPVKTVTTLDQACRAMGIRITGRIQRAQNNTAAKTSRARGKK